MLDKDFLFGAATSAYQIEGAWNEDGKALSIWDAISHGDTNYRVENTHTGDIASDHYHQWKTDVELMKELGLQAYRFSISWSRICTQQDMCSNLKGVEFYRNLVNKLISNGIEPFVTLYHWDLPKWLDDIGGWSNPKSIDYFVKYAETMFEALPDVKHWITFNEPAVFIPNFWGHNNIPEAIRNVLIAHAKTVEKYHENNHGGEIGITLNLMPISPNVYSSGKRLPSPGSLTGTKDCKGEDDIAVENADKTQNRIWLDPLYHGEFPEDINKLCGFNEELLKFDKDEQQTLRDNQMDFLGVNYYTALTVRYHKYKPPGFFETVPGNFEHDNMGIEIKPFGIYDLLTRLKKDYNDPIMYITENGRCCPDTFVHDSKIHDFERIRYIRQHLYYCNEAIKKGVKLKGYFYWSFMDNFEWLFGYNKRFGLLYVFYPTQSRVTKDSFHWYRRIITDKKFRERNIKI